MSAPKLYVEERKARPLRLLPQVDKAVVAASKRQRVSVNKWVELAVTEKLSREGEGKGR